MCTWLCDSPCSPSHLLLMDPGPQAPAQAFKQAGTGSGQGCMGPSSDPKACFWWNISFQLTNNHYFSPGKWKLAPECQQEISNSGLSTDRERLIGHRPTGSLMDEGCAIDYWRPFEPSQGVSLLYFSWEGLQQHPSHQLDCRSAVPCAPNPKGKNP